MPAIVSIDLLKELHIGMLKRMQLDLIMSILSREMILLCSDVITYIPQSYSCAFWNPDPCASVLRRTTGYCCIRTQRGQ